MKIICNIINIFIHIYSDYLYNIETFTIIYTKITNSFQIQQISVDVLHTILYVLPDIAYQDLGTVMILQTAQMVLMNITAVRYIDSAAWELKEETIYHHHALITHFQHSM